MNRRKIDYVVIAMNIKPQDIGLFKVNDLPPTPSFVGSREEKNRRNLNCFDEAFEHSKENPATPGHKKPDPNTRVRFFDLV